MRKLIIFVLLIFQSFGLTQTIALGQDGAMSDTSAPAKRAQVLKLAERIGLRADFENLYESKFDQGAKELAEARTLRHLWQAEFELKR
ncbi:MAG: hypothetical protein K2X81_13470, partial [Candidatus Obscuribacterales bacterium]|nr:hypothetical protein [Candidatus Obscuribacterales bacterium]